MKIIVELAITLKEIYWYPKHKNNTKSLYLNVERSEKQSYKLRKIETQLLDDNEQ